MNWKRGAFRIYLVFAVLFVLWATDKAFRADNVRSRNNLWQGCFAVADAQRSRLWPPDSDTINTATSACLDRAEEATPIWGEMIAKDPKGSALVATSILAVPVIVWWVFRGSAALLFWIGRGFKRETEAA